MAEKASNHFGKGFKVHKGKREEMKTIKLKNGVMNAGKIKISKSGEIILQFENYHHVIDGDTELCYADHVEQKIQDLEAENERLKNEPCNDGEKCGAYWKLHAENERLKKDINTLKTAYEQSQSALSAIAALKLAAEEKLRATRRALWLARAERAKDRQQYENVCRLDGWVHRINKWIEVERKCLNKAEEYK